jgi:hypothetical protein
MHDDNGEGREKAETTSIPAILSTLSQEVRQLSIEASDLQNLIGNLVVAGAFGGSHSIYELQNLDRLCQNLGAIADFVSGLADHSSANWKLDVESASEKVKLADLRDRLIGQGGDRPDATGEFEDFEAWPLTL